MKIKNNIFPRLNTLPLKYFLPAFLAAVFATQCANTCAQTSVSPVQILTNAAQLRALSLEEAERKLPVQLHAIVTTVDPAHSIFIQDETGGTFIRQLTADRALTSGEIIEVKGVSYPGFFLPGINPEKITSLGRGELPAPQPVTLDDLFSTRFHYQRVQVRGIVRSITPAPEQSRIFLKLAMGSRQLEVQILTPTAINLPPLINAKVRIVGLAAGYLNLKRQLIAPHLIVSQLEDVHLESRPKVSAFDMPFSSFRELLNFDPAGVTSHHVRVRGVVTHQQPGEAIFLREGEFGLLVQTAQTGIVRPGDIVEAVGFPVMGRFSAYLEDADFRKVGSEPAPQPVPTTLAQVLQGTNDVNLVSMTGQLLEVLENDNATTLVLRSDENVWRARLPRASLSLRNGSQLRLTGVCLAEETALASQAFRANPRTIELLLRAPSDIEVISMPSWWNAQRLAVAVSLLLGFGMVALFWILMLRRRVARQAEVIREKAQREATLEERHRMAREMHDTLAQSFSGLGFQLDALQVGLPPEADVARQRLETARQMVRHGQEDFRRSLMNLRAQELERGDLNEALPEFARHILTGTGIELTCDISCPPRDLSESVENNLLRIGQECLTNSMHHGRPKKITVSLSRNNGFVQLRIADDGVGFEPEKLQRPAHGHFGWRGIQERAEQIRGNVELKSQPGRGTVVTITVPI
ncbi:MAG: sensor histidine kinase [Verrucomicrobiota bacterium]